MIIDFLYTATLELVYFSANHPLTREGQTGHRSKIAIDSIPNDGTITSAESKAHSEDSNWQDSTIKPRGTQEKKDHQNPATRPPLTTILNQTSVLTNVKLFKKF